MISKKVCLLGSFSVGKTSLIRRYVSSIFDERYHTTLGVKINKKIVPLAKDIIQMMVWDIEGQDMFKQLTVSYLKGSSGIILVADGTREQSLLKVVELEANARAVCFDIPIVLLLNKADLEDQWRLSEDDILSLKERGWQIFKTSAKTGWNVNEAFEYLATKMLQQHS